MDHKGWKVPLEDLVLVGSQEKLDPLDQKAYRVLKERQEEMEFQEDLGHQDQLLHSLFLQIQNIKM